jgi:CheY-like chemotaxis protein
MCVVADSWTVELEKRIEWLNSEIPDVPFVLLLNYPRESDAESIAAAGVSAVVSKPFELQDLKVAISGAAGKELQCPKA